MADFLTLEYVKWQYKKSEYLRKYFTIRDDAHYRSSCIPVTVQSQSDKI